MLSRLGGNVAFDLSHLRPYGADTELTDLGAALVSYAALTTWLFDDPRLYKSGRLRNLGRQLARELGIRRLRQELNRFAYDADDVVVFLSLSEIELGSVEFLQKLALVSGILAGVTSVAADAPQAYKHTKEIYAPAVMEAVYSGADFAVDAIEVTGEFLEEYFSELEKILDVTTLPAGPTPTRRVLSDERLFKRARKARLRQRVSRDKGL